MSISGQILPEDQKGVPDLQRGRQHGSFMIEPIRLRLKRSLRTRMYSRRMGGMGRVDGERLTENTGYTNIVRIPIPRRGIQRLVKAAYLRFHFFR